ncbi:hypothetical protein H2248_008975 [Termitomyces sp. 'cryptogamus']|nr:hypothetical protein H2248_008975 [Termitomyces sp. 'cryptogamus']
MFFLRRLIRVVSSPSIIKHINAMVYPTNNEPNHAKDTGNEVKNNMGSLAGDRDA